MSDDAAFRNLSQVQHIVVLMMENRSFDQMLGYLKRAGLPDVDGLTGSESNPDAQGVEHFSFEWGPGQTVFHPPRDLSGKILDPCHSEECVREQLADGNRGFVRNFLATRELSGRHVEIPGEYRALPMGYYTEAHLPAYDYLARNYCVCDAWHSSVPGDTWPNRLFALAGRKGPRVHMPLLKRLSAKLKRPELANVPLYDVRAFTRELSDRQWRWYSHDPATLRCADRSYRKFKNLERDRDNFAFFDRQRVSSLTRALEFPAVTPDSFIDDAARGRLRQVSWIDPNFVDLSVFDPNSDDDHPPSDIEAGQALVMETYQALRSSPNWEDTLLVVLYDEHGGFYDHVRPPPLGFDDGSGYETYGVRVPALLVGPRVRPHVCHELFDHASLIKTILTRFAGDPAGAIARMGPRVQRATHLGAALNDAPRASRPDPTDAVGRLDAWRVQARADRRARRGAVMSLAPDGAGRPFALHEFQEEFVRFAFAMQHLGLPHGEP